MGGSSGKEREDVAMVVGLVFWSVANKLTFSCACNKIKYTQRRLAGEYVVTLIWRQSENMLLINVACPHRIGTQCFANVFQGGKPADSRANQVFPLTKGSCVPSMYVMLLLRAKSVASTGNTGKSITCHLTS